jgi:hypothetical protein
MVAARMQWVVGSAFVITAGHMGLAQLVTCARGRREEPYAAGHRLPLAGPQVTYRELVQRVVDRFPEGLERLDDPRGEVAKNFRLPGFQGSVSFITSMTSAFCSDCNRCSPTLLSTPYCDVVESGPVQDGSCDCSCGYHHAYYMYTIYIYIYIYLYP